MKKYLVRLVLALGLGLGFSAIAMPVAAKDLVSIMKQDMGDRRPGGCPSKWCACYMNIVLAKAGKQTIPSNRARDFSKYGKKARPGAKGSIMVMAHHVGVVAGKCDDGRVLLISGNYSRKVGLGCYHPKKAIAWRKPG